MPLFLTADTGVTERVKSGVVEAATMAGGNVCAAWPDEAGAAAIVNKVQKRSMVFTFNVV